MDGAFLVVVDVGGCGVVDCGGVDHAVVAATSSSGQGQQFVLLDTGAEHD